MKFDQVKRLMMNWPRLVNIERVGFMSKELDEYAEEDIESAISRVLRSHEYPPTLAELHQLCADAARRRTGVDPSSSRKRRQPRPGDVVDIGAGPEKTLTPQEASDWLDRLAQDRIDLFLPAAKDRPMSTKEERRTALQDDVERMWIAALKRCAGKAEEPKLENAVQRPLI